MLYIILLLQIVAFFVEWLFMLPVILLSYRVKMAQFIYRLPANPIFPDDVMALSVFPQHCDPSAEWRAYFETLADRLFSALIPIFLLASALCALIQLIFSFLSNLLTQSQPFAQTGPMGRHNAFTSQGVKAFHTSSLVSSGLSRHNTHPSVPVKLSQNDTRPYWLPGEILPEATQFLYELPSIHSSNFLEELLSFLQQILTPPGSRFNIMVECQMEGNRFRSLAPSFHATPGVTITDLEGHFNTFIENFEAQSGTGETGPSVLSCRAVITNISSAPNPEARPFSSSPDNVQWKQDIKADKKTTRRPTVTTQSLNNLSSQMDSQFKNLNSSIHSGLKEVVQAIKAQPPVTSSLAGINWAPIIQGLITGVASSLGTSVSFPTPQANSPVEVQKTPSVDLSPVLSRLDKIESKYSNLESTVSTLVQGLTQTNDSVNTLAQTLEAFIKASTPSGTSNGNSTGSSLSNGYPVSSTPSSPKTPPSYLHEKAEREGKSVVEYPSIVMIANKLNLSSNDVVVFSEDDIGSPISQNTPKKLPFSLPEISTLNPADQNINFEGGICTADLEALILPDGTNYVYMASWYNGPLEIGGTSNIFDIAQFKYNQDQFLKHFWFDLIKNNEGRICYFHNWGGYDSILSLPQLLDFDPNLEFNPIMKDGELMSIEVKRGTTHLITIKDSIRIIPGALGKLAKDWKVETQKDHFPHYFYNGSIPSTLNYVGHIPSYSYFEPKRTSSSDYELMSQEFSSKPWSFLEVSRQYILGDCVALYQILLKFFGTLNEEFPINPLKVLSAPSAAFKIWRTVQLPLLKNEENVSVYDFSNTEVDKLFRTSYCGGIVDVYRPHLLGSKQL